MRKEKENISEIIVINLPMALGLTTQWQKQQQKWQRLTSRLGRPASEDRSDCWDPGRSWQFSYYCEFSNVIKDSFQASCI